MIPELPQVTVTAGGAKHILGQHPWVFTNNISLVSGEPQAGALVQVVDMHKHVLGFGYYNAKSLIPLRMLYSPQAKRSSDGSLDEVFELERKLNRAYSKRQNLNLDSNAYRLIWSEADGLPGVVCDVYNQDVVVQFLTAGAELRKPIILNWLITHLKPRGIFEKSLGPYRQLEGLKSIQSWSYLNPDLAGTPEPETEITENQLRFRVDFEHSQKTGFFLDQRSARRLVGSLPLSGKQVLDTFSYTGGFAIAAAKAGASRITAVDVSPHAITQLNQNAGLNHCQESITAIQANVFDYLVEAEQLKQQYDLIILDPPSFTRSNANAPKALKGFKELHYRAARLIKPKGLMLSCSCSHSVARHDFKEAVLSGVRKAGRKIDFKSIFGPDRDHPEVSQIPETRYLNCILSQIT